MKIKKPLRAAERFGKIIVGGSDQQAQNSRRVSPASRRSSRLFNLWLIEDKRINARIRVCQLQPAG
jgi:hypothetical protein